MEYRNILLILLITIMLPMVMWAQTVDQDAVREKQYEALVKKTYINKVYIPKDVHDAIKTLKSMSDSTGLAKLATAKESEVAKRLRFGIGSWMQINWNLDEGSRLVAYFRSIGISYPDDMVDFLIVSLYRDVNGLPLEIEQRAKIIADARHQAYQEKLKKAKVIDILPAPQSE